MKLTTALQMDRLRIIFFSTLQTRSDLWIPRNETARPSSQFLHSCICERSVHLLFCSKVGGPIVGIYKSLTDILMQELGWERSRAVLFLGIFVSNFRYSVFAVPSGHQLFLCNRMDWLLLYSRVYYTVQCTMYTR